MHVNKSIEIDVKLYQCFDFFKPFSWILLFVKSIISYHIFIKNIILSFLIVYNAARNYNFYCHIYVLLYIYTYTYINYIYNLLQF